MGKASRKALKGKRTATLKDLKPKAAGAVKGGKEPGKLEYPNLK